MGGGGFHKVFISCLKKSICHLVSAVASQTFSVGTARQVFPGVCVEQNDNATTVPQPHCVPSSP